MAKKKNSKKTETRQNVVEAIGVGRLDKVSPAAYRKRAKEIERVIKRGKLSKVLLEKARLAMGRDLTRAKHFKK